VIFDPPTVTANDRGLLVKWRVKCCKGAASFACPGPTVGERFFFMADSNCSRSRQDTGVGQRAPSGSTAPAVIDPAFTKLRPAP
jgi:hypothetical protein